MEIDSGGIIRRVRPARGRNYVLQGEDDAELGFATGHAGVGFVDFCERELFDHGADAGKFGETQSVFGIGGDAGGPALNGLAAADHEAGLNGERIAAGADDEEFAVGREAGDQFGHGFAAGGGGEDDLSAAEFLKLLDSVPGGAVNVDMRAEFFGERFAVFAAADGGHAIAGLAGELHAEMAEAADSLNGDQVARERAAVAKSVEGGDARAEKRSGFGGIERIGHGGDGLRGDDGVLGIAAVEAEAGDFFVGAIDEVAAAALQAGSVMAAVPADAYALTFLPSRDAGTDFINDAGDFVAGRARIGYAGPEAVFDEMVAKANAAGLHADADVSRGRLGDFAFLQFEVGAGLGDYGDFHFGHRGVP